MNSKLNRREEFRQKHREDKLPDKPTIYPSKVPLSDLETRLPIRLVRYSYQDFAEHPRILQRLHDVRTSSGRNVTLTVRIRGWPECEVNWFKDGVPLARHRPENVVVRRYGAELFELHINGSIAADAGYYSCTAHNCAGAVQTTGHVHVEVYSGPYLPVRLPCLCLRKMWF